MSDLQQCRLQNYFVQALRGSGGGIRGSRAGAEISPDQLEMPEARLTVDAPDVNGDAEAFRPMDAVHGVLTQLPRGRAAHEQYIKG